MITQLKHDIKYMHVLLNLGIPPDKAAEWKITIEDLVTRLEEMEKEEKQVTYVTTQF